MDLSCSNGTSPDVGESSCIILLLPPRRPSSLWLPGKSVLQSLVKTLPPLGRIELHLQQGCLHTRLPAGLSTPQPQSPFSHLGDSYSLGIKGTDNQCSNPNSSITCFMTLGNYITSLCLTCDMWRIMVSKIDGD